MVWWFWFLCHTTRKNQLSGFPQIFGQSDFFSFTGDAQRATVCFPQINCSQTSRSVQRGNFLNLWLKILGAKYFSRLLLIQNPFLRIRKKYSPWKWKLFSGFCFLGCRVAFPQINCFQTRWNCNILRLRKMQTVFRKGCTKNGKVMVQWNSTYLNNY